VCVFYNPLGLIRIIVYKSTDGAIELNKAPSV